MAMDEEIWKRLAADYAEFADAAAPPATAEEINAAERQLGLPFPPQYRELLLRYGGAYVGQYEILGVREPALSRGEEPERRNQVVAENEEYRRNRWPAIDRVLVFCTDGSGNPIGFGPDGRVWKSDHNAAFVYEWKANTFEEF